MRANFGTMTKPFHPGAAARAGLSDVRLETIPVLPWLRSRLATLSRPDMPELELDDDGIELDVTVSCDKALLGRALENLVNLTELELDDTQVSDISPLSKAKKLERLSIRRTLVTDVSPLKDLLKLKYLYVEGSAVTDISPLQPAIGRGLKIVSKGDK